MGELARQGKVIVNWNGKNVTEDIACFISSVTYTDHEEGSSDEITIVLDDSEGLWSGDWYPEDADTIELFMGYTDNLVNCGLFQVDEVSFSGKPDMIEVKAISAGITKALRSKNNKAFEAQNLHQIAEYFCKKHNFKLIDETIATVTDTTGGISYADTGKSLSNIAQQLAPFVIKNDREGSVSFIESVESDLRDIATKIQTGFSTYANAILKYTAITHPTDDVKNMKDSDFMYLVNRYAKQLNEIGILLISNKTPVITRTFKESMLTLINLDRKTQESKTDLAFLSELAAEYGLIFSITGDKLIFTSYYNLDNADSVKSIDKNQLSNFSIKEKTAETYASGMISKRDSKTNKVIEWHATEVMSGRSTDQAIFAGRVENARQAEAKVKAGLWKKNKYKHTGNLNDLPGDPSLVAGTNFDLTGMGTAMSGKYHITTSTHNISGSGAYTTSLEIRKTGDIPKPKQLSKQQPEKDEVYNTNIPDYLETQDQNEKFNKESEVSE